MRTLMTVGIYICICTGDGSISFGRGGVDNVTLISCICGRTVNDAIHGFECICACNTGITLCPFSSAFGRILGVCGGWAHD